MIRALRRRRDESGAAMITTLLVSAVLAGLGIAIVNVSLANLQNAGRDRLGGTALNTSESGVAQAIEYIKTNGVYGLTCSPNCVGNPWGNSASPQTVTLSSGRQYRVWIEVIQPFSPPTTKVGTYRIHSLGTVGTGPGSRRLEVTVNARPFEFPIGLYADTYEDAGNGSVHTEHMFARDCIVNRNSIAFGPSTDPETGQTNELDPFYGYPPAAHSANYIITDNQASHCNVNRSIHTPADCNNSFRADQDAAGGSISATVCQPVTMGNGTSLFTMDDLVQIYGYKARGLTNAEYAALKSKAQSQGNYWTDATLGSYRPPCVNLCPAGKMPTPNGILYFKVAANTTIDTQITAISEFPRGSCGSRSLVVVVEGGSMHVSSNVQLTAAVFVPDGNVRFNGGAVLEGTLFAKTVNKFNGTADFYLDPCFIRNFPGGLMEVTPLRFREVDR